MTLADIAERVGVSRGTVSEVLRGVGRSSERTRQRVHTAANELGYRVNASAKAMRYGRFHALSLLMSFDQPHFRMLDRVWNGLHDALHRHDLQLSVSRIAESDVAAPQADGVEGGDGPKVFREAMADGFLVYPGVAEEVTRWLERFRLPAVWVNSKRATGSVYVDDFDCARSAVEGLLKLGHQRVAYVDFIGALAEPTGGRMRHYSGPERWSGYAAAMESAGLEPVRLGGDRFTPPEGRLAGARAVLDRPDRPTAVLTYSAASATPVLFAAARLGLDVPGDLSLVSFDHAPLCDTGIAVDTVVLPEEEMGRRAVEMLVRRIADGSSPAPSEGLGCSYITGVTVGPPVAG